MYQSLTRIRKTLTSRTVIAIIIAVMMIMMMIILKDAFDIDIIIVDNSRWWANNPIKNNHLWIILDLILMYILYRVSILLVDQGHN